MLSLIKLSILAVLMISRPKVSLSTCRQLLALDFDGVICASSLESSVSAITASKALWPSSIQSETDASSIKHALMKLRPYVETGYENMLMVKALAKDISNIENSVRNIKETWSPRARDEMLRELKYSKV